MIITGSGNRLAVECDGDDFHRSEENEDKDMIRQWELEKCGWTFWRVFYSQFCLDEEKALESLWRKLEDMKMYPLVEERGSKKEIFFSENDKIKQLPAGNNLIGPFDITQFSNIDPREDSLENIKKGLFNIIKNECPIVTDRLYRLYVKSCSIMKVGKQIHKKLNKAISSLMRERLVCFEKESNNIKDKVFYLPNGPSVIVRQRTNRKHC